MQPVDRVYDSDAGVALSAQFDVQDDEVIPLLGDRLFGFVAGKPLIHAHARFCRFDPTAKLVARGTVIFDDGYFQHVGDPERGRDSSDYPFLYRNSQAFAVKVSSRMWP